MANSTSGSCTVPYAARRVKLSTFSPLTAQLAPFLRTQAGFQSRYYNCTGDSATILIVETFS